MRHIMADDGSAVIQQIVNRVKETTHGRIRDLCVEKVQGQYVVRGQAPSHHARQLALHAALEVLASNDLRSCITVG